MYVCPRTGGPLKDWRSVAGHVTYPLLDGVPVLLSDPMALLASQPPRSTAAAEPGRCGLPDPITPHLPPALFGAPAGFGQWLTSLGDVGPDSLALGFASRYAPAGPALDVGCGVGTMARRMVTAGRPTWAFDRSPDAVLLARGLLCGALQQTVIPTSRRGLRRVKVPFKPITANLEFCIADAARPPFPPDSFAWVHLGDVLDELGDDVAEVLVACEGLLKRGGVLTVTTAYSAEATPSETAQAPEEELLEALEGLGLQVIDQQDRVPQVVREYDRGYRIRFVHVVAARKK
ncbi:MAG: class I SAM-dependent methyltransferase [Pseudomonadota bacterium]|nr:class I SAM-dependent methyltransferase [Pseudomonadota bacterium]